MEIVKKNIVSILCGVVALAAIIATFYPLGSMFGELKKDAARRADAGKQLIVLEKKPRAIPGNGLTQPEAIQGLPALKLIEFVRTNIKDSLKQQARDIEAKAVEISDRDHALLTPDALPKPTPSAPYDFRIRYAEELKRLKTAVLHSGWPADAKAIAARSDMVNTEVDRQIQKVGDHVTNQPEIDALRKERLAAVPGILRQEVANSCSIYVYPNALKPDDTIIATDKTPTVKVIWYAQVGCWIASDVCQAIASTNASDPKFVNVKFTPVKALVNLDLPITSSLYVLSSATPSNFSHKPGEVVASYMSAKPDAKHDPLFNLSPTGRATNSLYDTVTFKMTVIVDARYAQIFVRNLQINRFITVVSMTQASQDADDLNNLASGSSMGSMGAGGAAIDTAGFEFGSVPLVRLDLQCEELFLRTTTGKWMPDVVKTELGIPVTP